MTNHIGCAAGVRRSAKPVLVEQCRQPPAVAHRQRMLGAEASPASEWSAVTARLDGVRLYVQTGRVGFAAAGGFDGVYTYDVLVFGAGTFARICEQARRRRLACAPSVGPGFDARRAVGETRVKPRRNGATYDRMWAAALAARPERVTITSYNEWHEGTQIEPARPSHAADGARYADYEGAYGARGRAAQRAYLDRTAYWAARFAATRGGTGGCPGFADPRLPCPPTRLP